MVSSGSNSYETALQQIRAALAAKLNATENMEQDYLSTIETLIKVLEVKNRYTKGHSERVARYALAIAKELNLNEARLETIKFTAILHDVGKIGVSEKILNKQGELVDEERTAIRAHTLLGQEIVSDIDFLRDIGKGIRHHHERYDGQGYPDGLKGEEIPLEARIVAVADCFDAMTSDRSYRLRRDTGKALRELHRVSGSQLDPELVKVFSRLLPSLRQGD